ncbi:lysine 2,3-aminomutase [Bradyrhizobium sp. SZCCHNR2035]|uniref:KamA family radical SAM protein n=1 Tax=Bradyrhizobium sp. SZCCHNR2035 TaxID=3057386 RepID=UPI002916EB90|nr:lysine 2,3-aminomutase [Bradyrhizobium sp. SZCCHNR2035]
MSAEFAMAGPAERSDSRSRLVIHTEPNPDRIPELMVLSERDRADLRILARIFPFRVSQYVIDELIDWSAAPDDPMYRLVFPCRESIGHDAFERVARAISTGAPASELRELLRSVRSELNPHPADQLSLNRPIFEGEQISGLQHKYPETVLFFPSDGQSCHSYCTFCFRWAQFVREDDWRMAMNDRERLTRYLAFHSEVSDLLITGGDAFTLKARRLRFFLEPIVELPSLEHVTNIRFGTKALSFWPHRFVDDGDSEELLQMIAWLVARGKHVSIMAHFNHWMELETPVVALAIARLQKAGAVVRTQGPILRAINDDAATWARLWKRQTELGLVPYYMFVARNTGAVKHFAVALDRAWHIFAEAARQVSGIARTVRGPSMSDSAGKIEILGVDKVAGQKVFVMRMLQARDPKLAYQPFFAVHDDRATWIDTLKPAFAEAFPFDEARQGKPESACEISTR